MRTYEERVMNGWIVRVRRGGASGGTIAAIVVGGLLLIAIGVVIGRGTATAPAVEDNQVAGGDASLDLPPARDWDVLPRPPFVFDPPMIDFGVVDAAIELREVVTLRNVSDEPLRIQAMKPDCRCTAIQDYTGKVIAPGGSIDFDIVFETPKYMGPKGASVRFIFEKYGYAELKIQSLVAREVMAEPSYIRAQDARSGVITVKTMDREPFRILAADNRPPVYADGFDPEQDEPRSEYQLAWDLTEYDNKTCENSDGRRMPKWWVIETDHPAAPIIDVRVRHLPCTQIEAPNRNRRWLIRDFHVVLDDITAGEAGEFTTRMQWLKGMEPNETISSIESECDDFHAVLLPLERDGDDTICRVRIIPTPGFTGLIYGDVRFNGSLAGNSQALTVIGRVFAPEDEDAPAAE
jgi:hypothetical protein